MRVLKFILLSTVFIGTPLIMTYQGHQVKKAKEQVVVMEKGTDTLGIKLQYIEEINQLKRENEKIRYENKTEQLEDSIDEIEKEKSKLEEEIDSRIRNEKQLEDEIERLKNRIRNNVELEDCLGDYATDMERFLKAPTSFDYSDESGKLRNTEENLRNGICVRLFSARDVLQDSSIELTINERTSRKENREAISPQITQFLSYLTSIQDKVYNDRTQLLNDSTELKLNYDAMLDKLVCLNSKQSSSRMDSILITQRKLAFAEIIRRNYDKTESFLVEIRSVKDLYSSIGYTIDYIEDTAPLKSKARLGSDYNLILAEFCESVDLLKPSRISRKENDVKNKIPKRRGKGEKVRLKKQSKS